MLNWCFVLITLAIIFAILGLTGIASVAILLAKIFFYVFLVLFFLSLIDGRKFP